MSRWEEQSQTWKMMPVSSSVLFFAGVFCLFASLVLIGSSMNFQSQTVLDLIGSALISGGFAIGWAYAGTRRIIWLFFVVFLLQAAANFLQAWLSGPHQTLAANSQELKHKLQLNGGLCRSYWLSPVILCSFS